MHAEYLKVEQGAAIEEVVAAVATYPEHDDWWAEVRGSLPGWLPWFPVTVYMYGRAAVGFVDEFSAHLSAALGVRVINDEVAGEELEERRADARRAVPLGD